MEVAKGASSKTDPLIKMLVQALEQTADNVMITDKSGIIQYVNSAFEKTTGFAREDCFGKTPKILESGRHDIEYYNRLWSTILAGEVFYSTTINKKKNGELYYSDQTIAPVKNEYGEVTHFVSVWKDVTERIRLDEKFKDLYRSLRLEKYKLEQILSFNEKIIAFHDLNELADFIVQKSCDILDSGRCSLLLLDRTTNEICLKASKGLSEENVKSASRPDNQAIVSYVIRTNRPLLVKDVTHGPQFRRMNRFGYLTRSFMSVPLQINNKLIGVVNVTDKKGKSEEGYTDLELKVLVSLLREAAVAIENAQMYKEFKFMTVTDPLTRLHNFRYFSETIDREINRIKRFVRPLSLLMIDVDDFKSYNDSFGHPEGDNLLISAGHIIKQQLRQIDVLCRYAGDEFVVILPETDVAGATTVCEKILQAFDSSHFKRKVTISIGGALCLPGMDRIDAVSKADRALYEAKRSGGKRYCINP